MEFGSETMLLSRYREFLPVTELTPLISMGEGHTPLVRAEAISRETGCEVYCKLEGCNPTGSFKDRGMVVAIAKALEEGARTVICASTGNTAASAAAYAARTGLVCAVVIPHGNIALGKLSQAVAYGARVLPVEGSFDRALDLVRDLARTTPIVVVNSINPYRIEGQKTAAFEIIEALGRAPGLLALPVGNAGNITAYWKGFCEWYARGRAATRPRLLGFQAEGAAPIVNGAPVAEPRTRATAIRIGNPASWQSAVRARDESGGLIEAVSEAEIIAAYDFLAQREGLFVELASAASVAGLFRLAGAGRLPHGQTIVCILTGHGLKDPDFALSRIAPFAALPPTVEALRAALGL